MVEYCSRTIEPELRLSLEAFGAVQIAGPKWCGKTTTSKQFIRSAIDIDKVLASSPADKDRIELLPDSVLAGEKPRLIDEWQLSPGIWDAVRRNVDDIGGSGLFILAESSAVDSSKIKHSGAGRIGTIFMRTMGLHESGQSTGGVSLSDLFQGKDKVSDYTENGTEAIARLLVLGGWPGTLGRSDAAIRKNVEGYCHRIVNGTSQLPGDFIPNPERMVAVLTSLSRNVSTTASKASILADVTSSGRSMSGSTLDRYLAYLRRNYVIEDLPNWSPKLRTKTVIRSSPVRHFFDPAIAAMLLDATPTDLLNDFETFGFLFESMVVRDIRSYAQAIDGKVYHYRDKDGLECDIIIRLGDGRWGAMEVKLGSERGIEEGARNLLRFRDKVSDRFRSRLSFMAIVVSTNLAYTRADGIHVIPLACLKERCPSEQVGDEPGDTGLDLLQEGPVLVHLGCVLRAGFQVPEERIVHPFPDILGMDHRVRFEVKLHAPLIEVRGSDGASPPVDDHRLGVDESVAVFVHLHAVAHQVVGVLAVAPVDERMVRLVRDDDPDIHSAHRRSSQGVHARLVRSEIGGVQQDGILCALDHHQVLERDAVPPLHVRSAVDYLDGDAPGSAAGVAGVV